MSKAVLVLSLHERGCALLRVRTVRCLRISPLYPYRSSSRTRYEKEGPDKMHTKLGTKACAGLVQG